MSCKLKFKEAINNLRYDLGKVEGKPLISGTVTREKGLKHNQKVSDYVKKLNNRIEEFNKVVKQIGLKGSIAEVFVYKYGGDKDANMYSFYHRNVTEIRFNKDLADQIDQWKKERGLYEEQIPITDYLNYPERFNKFSIKPGVGELFESNSELANNVYEVLGFETPTTELQGKKAIQSRGEIPVNFDVIKELASGERSNLPSSILIKKLLEGGYLPKINETNIILGVRESGVWKPSLKRLEAYGRTESTLAKKIGHELLHSVTENIITSYQNLKGVIDFNNKYYKDFIKQGYIKPVNLTKSQVEALDNLVRIKNKVVAYVEQNKDKIQKQDRGFGTYDYFIRTNYTESETDLHEFISEVFTNPELINILKEIPSEGNKSNLFKDFVDAIAKILGFSNTSILEDVIAYSEEAFFAQPLITPQQKQQAQQLYSQYLDTIFPDSQVRDIVYHSTPHYGFDKFSRINIGTSDKAGIAGFDFLRSLDATKRYLKGEFIKGKKEGTYAVILNSNKTASYQEALLEKQKAIEIIDSLLNDNFITKEIHKQLENYIETPQYGTSNVYSGTLLSKIFTEVKNDSNVEKAEKAINEYISLTGIDTYYQGKTPLEQDRTKISVFKPEQIHILGSKQDIENFAKFVKNNKPNNFYQLPQNKKIIKDLDNNNIVFYTGVADTVSEPQYSKEGMLGEGIYLTKNYKDALFYAKNKALKHNARPLVLSYNIEASNVEFVNSAEDITNYGDAVALPEYEEIRVNHISQLIPVQLDNQITNEQRFQMFYEDNLDMDENEARDYFFSCKI